MDTKNQNRNRVKYLKSNKNNNAKKLIKITKNTLKIYIYKKLLIRIIQKYNLNNKKVNTQ